MPAVNTPPSFMSNGSFIDLLMFLSFIFFFFFPFAENSKGWFLAYVELLPACFFVRVLELTCLWVLWLMYMRSVIIPHLALFNVMITLGELAWLCNCGGFTQIKDPGLKTASSDYLAL